MDEGFAEKANDQQAAVIAALRGENKKLRGAVRWYRERNMKAYADSLKETREKNVKEGMRLALYITLPIIGMFVGTAITLAVCLGGIG